jgi:hypothetical protein
MNGELEEIWKEITWLGLRTKERKTDVKKELKKEACQWDEWRNWAGGCGLDSSVSEQGPAADPCGQSEVLPVLLNSRRFLEYLSNYQLLEKDCAPWSYNLTSTQLNKFVGTRWGWVVSVTPRPRFTPGERTPGTHCTGGWVDPRVGLDKEARGNILCPCLGSNPDRPIVQPVVRHYTAWANPAPNLKYVNKLIPTARKV